MISVIITTYNRLNFLKTAIKSVLSQSYKDYELIVVDDGSNDGTEEYIKKHHQNHIKFIYQNNSGISSARNTGLKYAKGTYIAFLDADDQWKKNKLQIQYNEIIKNPNIALNYTDEIWLRNDKFLNQKNIHRKYSGWIFSKCLPLCIISPSSALIKKNIFDDIGYFDETMEVCEDYDLWLRITLKYPVQFIEKKLIIKYGGHNDQLSKKYFGMDRFRIYSLLKLLKRTDINKNNKLLIVNEIRKKYKVIKTGCMKRNKNIKEFLFEPFVKSVS
jgi:glycosyltransferase involved in cell wall biosynthesis